MSESNRTCAPCVRDGMYRCSNEGSGFMTFVEDFKPIELRDLQPGPNSPQIFMLTYNHELENYSIALPPDVGPTSGLGLSYDAAKPFELITINSPKSFCIFPVSVEHRIYKITPAQGPVELVVALAPLIISPPVPPPMVALIESSDNVWLLMPVDM